MDKLCIIVTLYKSKSTIDFLLEEANKFSESCKLFEPEFVFVEDRCPEYSLKYLLSEINKYPNIKYIYYRLSKNFGAPKAMKCGFTCGNGDYYTTIGSDLQEGLGSVSRAYEKFKKENADVCFGVRKKRNDPIISKAYSSIYWYLYRRFIIQEIPPGGVDFFVCSRKVRDAFCEIQEITSFMIGLIYWLGFERVYIDYDRQERKYGESSWSFAKKLSYLSDSIFSYSKLPVNILMYTGAIGSILSLIIGLLTLIGKISGKVPVPGYTTLIIVICFFSSILILSISILGQYLWRVFDNTKKRPLYVIDKDFSSDA
jgi:polyisoprenyl-phosphate glycosyltransferase